MDQLDAGQAGNIAHQPRQTGYYSSQKAVMTKEDFESNFYKMTNKNRGHAVIINNWQFEQRLGRQDIPDSMEDCKKMEELLKSMGFVVGVYANCSVKEMQNIMTDVARMDHNESDCFVCVVRSYGDEGVFYGTDDSIVMDEFIKPIKGKSCPSLALKPKVFLVQACTEVQLQLEAQMGGADDGAEAEDEVVCTRRIPAEADVLTMYSVMPPGSCFIQAIYTEFTKKSSDGLPAWRKFDLLTLMTRVNNRVATDLESDSVKLAWFRQNKLRLPCITSLLTKDVLFC